MTLARIFIVTFLALLVLTLGSVPRLLYGSLHPEAVLIFYFAFLLSTSVGIVAAYRLKMKE